MKILVLAPHPFYSYRGTPIAVRSVLAEIGQGLDALKGPGIQLVVTAVATRFVASALLNDPEIMGIIADPNFMNAIMSYDMNSIENNAQTKKLMNNPKVKAISEKLGNKLDTSEY